MTSEPLARLEDAALLTGRGQFLDDLSPLPGTLAGAIVRSPHTHARIRHVGLSRARGAPGVAAVIGPAEALESTRPFPLSVRTPMPYYPSGTDKVRAAACACWWRSSAVACGPCFVVAKSVSQSIADDKNPCEVEFASTACGGAGACPRHPQE